MNAPTKKLCRQGDWDAGTFDRRLKEITPAPRNGRRRRSAAIGVVSFRCGVRARRHAIQRVVELLADRMPGLLLLPGVSGTCAWDWTEELLRSANEYDVALLFETCCEKDRVFLGYDPARGVLPNRLRQVFATSEEARRDPQCVENVLAECGRNSQRVFKFGCGPVGVLVCGENNVLRNRQAEGNAVEVRGHPERQSLFDGAPIVLNAAHTIMGNWPKLHKRLEFLSRGRLAAFCTNNDGGQSWRSAVVVYRDGCKIADGEEVVDGVKGVSLVSDLKDRFRVVVVERG